MILELFELNNPGQSSLNSWLRNFKSEEFFITNPSLRNLFRFNQNGVLLFLSAQTK